MNSYDSPIRHRDKPRILAVDDERITRRNIQRALEKSGYEVLTAEDGQTAINQCLEELPDLVLLDVIMPRLDGFSTCTELRKIAGYNYLPILILTGLNDMESIDKAFSAGSTDFITKPLNWSLLRQRVRYALRQTELYRSLQLSQQQLARAQAIAKLGYWEIDLEKNRITLPEQTRTLLGMEKQCCSLIEFAERLDVDEKDAMLECLERTVQTGEPFNLDHSFTASDGRRLAVHQQGELGDQKSKTLLGTFQDVTERKRAEELIEFHTYFDPATSLPNRAYLDQKISMLMETDNDVSSAVVVTLSFDRIRDVGTTIGSDAVNEFMQHAAARLREGVAGNIEVARLGIPTLGFLLHDAGTTADIESRCKAVMRLFREPIKLTGQQLHSDVSVGVATCAADKVHINLVNHSLTALRISVAAGGGDYRIYSLEMDEQTHRRIQLEHDIRTGLSASEFVCHYQPQIDTRTGLVTGMEALTRWLKPGGVAIAPDEFIPIAEQTGIIVDLGERILREACVFTHELHSAQRGDFRVGVNLSARQFARPGIVEDITNILRDTRLPPELLEIEITESIAMTNIEHAITILAELRTLGVTTSMDDFGTGYSSLSYLQKLPLDTLKIDQSFIRPIGPDGEHSDIAKAIVAMGHSLGLHIIAEGVEHAHQYKLMQELGCQEVQGYFFSHALAPPDFTLFVDKHVGAQKDSP